MWSLSQMFDDQRLPSSRAWSTLWKSKTGLTFYSLSGFPWFFLNVTINGDFRWFLSLKNLPRLTLSLMAGTLSHWTTTSSVEVNQNDIKMINLVDVLPLLAQGYSICVVSSEFHQLCVEVLLHLIHWQLSSYSYPFPLQHQSKLCLE